MQGTKVTFNQHTFMGYTAPQFHRETDFQNAAAPLYLFSENIHRLRAIEFLFDTIPHISFQTLLCMLNRPHHVAYKDDGLSPRAPRLDLLPAKDYFHCHSNATKRSFLGHKRAFESQKACYTHCNAGDERKGIREANPVREIISQRHTRVPKSDNDRYISASSDEAYTTFAEAQGFKPVSTNLPEDATAHWIGSPDARRILVFFHGKCKRFTIIALAKSAKKANRARGRFCIPSEDPIPIHLRRAAEGRR